MICVQCGSTASYGNLCKECRNKNKSNNFIKQYIVNELGIEEQKTLSMGCLWYRNNIINYNTGIYNNYYYSDLIILLNRIEKAICKKYKKELYNNQFFGADFTIIDSKPKFGINLFSRVLYFAVLENWIPTLFEKELDKCDKINKNKENNFVKDVPSLIKETTEKLDDLCFF